ncbi:MAG TPA: ABC transporter substrate-binding protein [Candidatus Acidoferrales bacterium]|nr:ABC transporter substrate-binding protein [Candidatus Acidoferrales bacterium]
MKRTLFAQITTSSLLATALFAAIAAFAARRPRYGGTLFIDFEGRISSLDPAQTPDSIADRIAQNRIFELISDRLVMLDQFGQPQPALAVSWTHDETYKHWEFMLRNVKLQDGSLIAVQAVVDSLQAANPSWHVSLRADNGPATAGPSTSKVIIDFDAPQPDLLYRLAEPHNSILVRQADGSFADTGPFRIVTWEPGNHAALTANADYWNGRPFVDAVDIQMGRTIRDRMIDLDLGKVDIVDVAADRARIDASRGVRISASPPSELLALVFLRSTTTKDVRVRQALSQAIDRASLVDFVLQKEGEPARGLVPQWCSGYAFLFSLPGAVLQSTGAMTQTPSSVALKLGYDSADAMERSIAERIAVNAQAAGIPLSTHPMPGGTANWQGLDAMIVRLPLSSPDPAVALEDFLQALAPVADLDSSLAGPLSDPTSLDELYSRERAVIDTYGVIPLAHVPEVVGLSARVRDWMPIHSGTWRLANVWLDGAQP